MRLASGGVYGLRSAVLCCASQERDPPPPPPLLIAVTSAACADEGCGLFLLRSSWQLQDAEPPTWEVCALRCSAAELQQARVQSATLVARAEANIAQQEQAMADIELAVGLQATAHEAEVAAGRGNEGVLVVLETTPRGEQRTIER